MKIGRRTLVFLILVMSMFGPLSTDMYLSALPTMLEEFGTAESTLSMSLYFFILAMAAGILISGPVSDKYGRKKVLLISLSVYIAACILCCMMTDVYAFIAFRVVEAVGSGGVLTSAFALIKDFYTGPELKRTLSVAAAIGVLGPILSPIIGNGLIILIDWRATFWFPAAIASVCLLISLGLPGSLPAERYGGTVFGSLARMASITKDRHFTAYMVMTCIFITVQLGYIAVSSYIYEDMGSSDIYTVALGTACIAGLGISVLQRRIAKTGVGHIRCCFAIGIAGCLMFLFAAEHSWVLLMVSMFFPCANTTTARAVGFGILMNHHPGDNGSVSALLNFTTFFFGFIGMAVASSFPRAMFINGLSYIFIAIMAVFTIMWIYLKRCGYPIAGLKE